MFCRLWVPEKWTHASPDIAVIKHHRRTGIMSHVRLEIRRHLLVDIATSRGKLLSQTLPLVSNMEKEGPQGPVITIGPERDLNLQHLGIHDMTAASLQEERTKTGLDQRQLTGAPYVINAVERVT
jgi:hypothetical protein